MPHSLLSSHVSQVTELLPADAPTTPWQLARALPELLANLAATLGSDYHLHGTAYVHRQALLHPTAIVEGVAIIGPQASIGPHVLLRGGVWVMAGAHVGGSSEIKQSIIGPRSAVAHLNYVGNSVVGADCNIEAGAVLANHFNERQDKTIWVCVDGDPQQIEVTKFGALVGDGSRIGANAVTSPGTILAPASVVARLSLVPATPPPVQAPSSRRR